MGFDNSYSGSPLDRARSFRLVQNADKAVDEFIRLRSTTADLSKRVKALEQELNDITADRVRLKLELERTSRRNTRLQELYENQTERVEKFKSAYERLRNDPAVKVSKVLARPRSLAKRVWEKARWTPVRPGVYALTASSPAAPPRNDEAGPAAGIETVPGSRNGTVQVDSASSPNAVPSPKGEPVQSRKSLLADARQAFFVRGAVLEAQALLIDMGSADVPDGDGFSINERDRAFIGQVNGFARFVNESPFVPPRNTDPGYLPAPRRIMYCAHSTGEFNSNGYSTRTSGLVSGLSANGEDVFVAARPGYPWDSRTSGPSLKPKRSNRQHEGVRYVYNPGPNLARTPLDVYFHQAADIYVREAMINRPSLIHSASNYFTAFPALLAARRLGIPFVYEVRGLWEITEAASKGVEWTRTEKFGVARDIESLVAREADEVLAITEEVRDELVHRGVSPERIRLVPNAADPARFVPVARDRALAAKLGLAADDFVVGYAGSMVPYEGLDVLVSAFARLCENTPEARLLLVGDGASLEGLKKQARDLGVSDKVIFAGRVGAGEIPKYLSLFDAAPCPRLSNLVTEMVSPLKPLEAMAAGIAVVGSDVAPLRHLLGEDEQRGLLFQAGDPVDLAKQLARLSENATFRNDLGRVARWWAVHERSWTAVAKRVSDAHKAHLTSSRTGRGREDRGKGAVRPLSSMRIGIIADEFTTKSLGFECELVSIDRESWREQLDEASLDAMLVESAWSGNDGQWQRGVGFYSDDEFEPLRSLLETCRQRGVPTIFWNKEDPVHINRFLRTAAHFDHVFTTDADCIPRYAGEAGQRAKSISSLPFFAQPHLHNPTPSARRYDHSVAYGGSYYGDRYPERSKELARILDEVREHGLTIYDRQVNHPGSPYRFPESLTPFVRGGLAYEDMVEAYKSHPVHVNVNSVAGSPTMFSRRVMELAACGTPVITGSGTGVPTFFAPHLPLATGIGAADLLAHYWLNDEAARNHDAWILHRLVNRAHLAGHRLALMLRTAGIQVSAPGLPEYALVVSELTRHTAESVLRQTHRPAVVVAREIADDGSALLAEAGIRVVDEEPGDLPSARFGAYLNDELLGEDLCRSAWLHSIASSTRTQTVQIDPQGLEIRGRALIEPGIASADKPWMGTNSAAGDEVVVVRRALQTVQPVGDDESVEGRGAAPSSQTILIAGHDLKFAGALIGRLRERGHRLLFDEWQDHGKHDPELSHQLLEQADTVFCEWSLGNAAWYADHLKKDQRLVVRFHSQELFTPYPERTRLNRVDRTIFVGKLVEEMATSRYAYTPGTTSVISNAVDSVHFNSDKVDGARFHLGLVGIVPMQKHIDRALDVLAELRREDDRYQLFIKGRTPQDYPWMLKREREMAFYEEQWNRIENDPYLRGAVHFDRHGDDMTEWYRKIGVVLSVSDFESFHLTLADGGASGALPVSLAWPGAEQIYPEHWLHLTTSEMARTIVGVTGNEAAYTRATEEARLFCRRFEASAVLDQLEAAVTGVVL